jgi:uncharacterized protein YejL (UPF0352 family)
VLVLILAFEPWVAHFSQLVNELVSRLVKHQVGPIDIKKNTVRFSSFGSAVFYFIIQQWLGQQWKMIVQNFSSLLCSVIHDFWEYVDDEPPLIVVWQLEPFIDLLHFGVVDPSLPNLDQL